jgi:ABC-2 type transport system permease protein
MATESRLKATSDYSPMAGFRNMLRKENARWWNLKSLAFQLVIWLVLLNALVAVVLFVVPDMVNNAVIETNITDASGKTQAALASYASPHEVANMGMGTFFQLAGFAVFIGAVIFGHDAILKERESGTVAWLMSKPLSRRAFVLAKLVAAIIGVMVIVLLVQGLITYAMCSIEQGSPMPVLPFLAGLGVLGLGILFYLTLALALGAFTLSRGITLGVPLLIGIIGGLILGVLQALDILRQVGYFVPWDLTSFGSSVATGASLASSEYWPWPIVATAVWVLLFIGAALWKFEQTEL